MWKYVCIFLLVSPYTYALVRTEDHVESTAHLKSVIKMETGPLSFEERMARCSNKGSWNETSSQCVCYDDFTGPSCNLHPKFTCSGNGMVSDTGECSCSFGYNGPTCASSIFPGLEFSRTRLDVIEGSSSDVYTIRLQTRPTSSVKVTVEQKDFEQPQVLVSRGGRGSNLVELEFDANNWAEEQQVVVGAVDDNWVEGLHSSLLLHRVYLESDDLSMRGKPGPEEPVLTVRIVDNDQAQVVFSPASEVQVTEGTVDSLTVSLLKPPFPGYKVHLDFMYVDPDDEKVLEIARKRVTLEDSRAQELSLYAPARHYADGNRTVLLDVIVNSRLVPFNRLANLPPLRFKVLDADFAAVVVSTPSNAERVVVDPATPVEKLSEAAAYFDVKLVSKPHFPVQMSFKLPAEFDKKRVQISPSEVHVSPENWDASHRVRVRGFEDGVVSGDEDIAVMLVTTCRDPKYDNLNQDVVIHLVDNDHPGLHLPEDQRSLHLCADPGCKTPYSVRLKSRPSAEVTLHLAVTAANSTSDQRGVAISPDQIVFTPEDWKTPRQVQLEAVSGDMCQDDNSWVEYLVAHSFGASADPAYSSLEVERDAREVAVRVSSSLSMSQDQLSGTFRPRERMLQTAPQVRTRTSILSYIEDNRDANGQLVMVLVDSQVTVTYSGNLVQAAVYVEDPDIYDTLSFESGSILSITGPLLTVTQTDAYRIEFTGTESAATYQTAFQNVYYGTPGPKISSTVKKIFFEVMSSTLSPVFATRTINIQETNHVPYTQSFDLVTTENKQKFGQLVGTDPEGTQVTFTILCQPGRGVLTLNNASTGSITFTPNLDDNGADTFIWKVADGLGLESVFQVGTITITPYNSKPVAPNVTVTVTAGEQFTGFFNESYDPDERDTSGSYCEPTYDWCIRDYTFTALPGDPAKTRLFMTQTDGSLLGPNALGTLTGIEPYYYDVDADATTSILLADTLPYIITDGLEWTSAEAYIHINIFVIIIFTPPIANPVNFTVMAGDTLVADLNGTAEDYSQSTLGYYFSVDGFRQTFQNNTYTLGTVSWSPNDVYPRFLYGPKFTYFAGTTVGVDTWYYMVEDRAFNFSTPGLVTIEILKRNEIPVASCAGYPESQFGDEAIQLAMYEGDLWDADSQLAWYNENFPNENQAYSDAVALFLNTTIPIFCKGPLVNADGSDNLCTDKAAELICRTGMDRDARMSHPSIPAMEVLEDQGGLHIGLHAFDFDGGYAATNYAVTSLPSRGTLYYSTETIFPSVQNGTAIPVKFNQTYSEVSGVAWIISYVPDEFGRGTPMDTFTWQTFDAGGVRSADMTVELNVQCTPGYYIDPNNTLACLPCPAGKFNNPGEGDQTVCYDCPSGSFSLGAVTECTLCPNKEYQDQRGQSSCIPCPDPNMVTRKEGSVSLDDCQCDLGTWAIDPGVTCEVCDPALVICDQYEQEIPKPIRVGDMVDPATGEVLNCRPNEACLKLETTEEVLDQKCFTGYTGLACRACLPNYFRNVGDCDECPGVAQSWVSVTMLMIFSVPCLQILSRTGKALGSIKVFVNYVQTMAIIRYFPLGWNENLKDTFDFMAVFNLDWYVLAPECLFKLEYPHRIWMVTLGNLLCALWLTAYYWFRKIYTPDRVGMYFHRQCYAAYLLFLSWNYLNLSVTSMQFFACVEMNGWTVLSLDPSIHCWEFGNQQNMHRNLLGIAIFSLVAYPLGILVMFAYVIIKNRAILLDAPAIRLSDDIDNINLDDDEEDDFERLYRLDEMWGFAYKRLDPPFFYWELVRMVRRLLTAVITVVHNPVEQVMLAMLVYLTSFVATLYAHPNDNEALDVMDTLSHICIIVMLVGGYTIKSGLMTHVMRNNVSNGINVMIYITAIILLLYIINDLQIFSGLRALEEEEDDMDEEEKAAMLKQKSSLEKGLRFALSKTRSLGSNLRSLTFGRGGVDTSEIKDGDKRKLKVLKAGKICFHKEFIGKLITYLNSDECTVKDVKQLEAVTQALISIHWENRRARRRDGKKDKAKEEGAGGDGESEAGDGAARSITSRDIPVESMASFKSGLSNTSFKLKMLGQTSMARKGDDDNSSTFSGTSFGKSTILSSTVAGGGRKSVAGSSQASDDAGGRRPGGRRDNKAWLPKCYEIIHSDKIIPTLKWLAFDVSDEEQALFWRWLDASAWKLSEEVEVEVQQQQEMEAGGTIPEEPEEGNPEKTAPKPDWKPPGPTVAEVLEKQEAAPELRMDANIEAGDGFDALLGGMKFAYEGGVGGPQIDPNSEQALKEAEALLKNQEAAPELRMDENVEAGEGFDALLGGMKFGYEGGVGGPEIAPVDSDPKGKGKAVVSEGMVENEQGESSKVSPAPDDGV